jgi:type IV secretion system protein VirD4
MAFKLPSTLADDDEGASIIEEVASIAERNREKKSSSRKDKKKKRKENNFSEPLWVTRVNPYGIPDHTLNHRTTPLMRSSNYYNDIYVPECMELSLHDDSGFFFGMKPYLGRGSYVGKAQNMDGHILVVGGPGSGKTEGVVIPTIMTWRGIQIIIDVKENLTTLWYALNRGRGKRVKIFSPAVEGGSGYDPFMFPRSDAPENLINNIRDIALALLPIPLEAKDPIWPMLAQYLLTGTLIYFFEMGMSFIDSMIMIQTMNVYELIKEIMEQGSASAKMFVNKIKGQKPEVLAGIGMDLARLVTFATDTRIGAALTSKGRTKDDMIDWNDLNFSNEPYDIILEIPENKLDQWEPMTTLMINQLVKTLEQRPDKHTAEGYILSPILIMMDEFPRLGKIPAIQSGLATLRSRNVTIALLTQSLSQLDRVYGHVAREEIVDCCGYKAILNVTSADNQRYFSDAIGTRIVGQQGINTNYDPSTNLMTGYGASITETREPAIHPHEFSTLKDITLFTPKGVFRVAKTPFHNNMQLFMPHRFRSKPLTCEYAII